MLRLYFKTISIFKQYWTIYDSNSNPDGNCYLDTSLVTFTYQIYWYIGRIIKLVEWIKPFFKICFWVTRHIGNWRFIIFSYSITKLTRPRNGNIPCSILVFSFEPFGKFVTFLAIFITVTRRHYESRFLANK